MSFTKLINGKMMPKHIYVDSKDAVFQIGPNEYIFELPEVIRANHLHDMYVGLISGTFPISSYNIASGANKIIILLTKDGVPDETLTITIPPGNMNLTQLLTKFNELMTAELASSSMGSINLAWSSFSNKVTLTAATDVKITISDQSTGLRLIGFTDGKSHTNNTNIITSDSLVDIRNTLSIFVKTDMVSSHVSTTDRHSRNSILAKIPVTVGNFESVNYTTTTPNILEVRRRSIKAFKIILEDEEHRPLNLNNMHWSCVICVYFSAKDPSAPPVSMEAQNFKYEDKKKPSGLLFDDITEIHQKYNIKDVKSRINVVEKNNVLV